ACVDRADVPTEGRPMAVNRWRSHPTIDAVTAWVIAYAARLWGALLLGLVVALSWQTLRGIHTHEVRLVLRTLDRRALFIAGLVTLLNIAIMGLYDVMAFAGTRTRAIQRWRFGAVAGPAIRFWLYRRSVSDLSELHAGIVSVTIAFVSGLAGWTVAALIVSRTGGGFALLAVLAVACASLAAWCGRVM